MFRREEYPEHLRTPIEKGEEKMSSKRAIEWITYSMCGGRYNIKTAHYYYFKDEVHIAGEMAIEAINTVEVQKAELESLRKAVKEVLLCLFVPFPCRTGKTASPVIWFFSVFGLAPNIIISFFVIL